MDDTRMKRLRSIPMFAGLGDDALASILDKMGEIEAPAGQVLVQPAREGSGMFVIEEGTVEVTNKDQTIELGPGEFFGELALLNPDAMRVARVRAKTDVRCIAIGRAEFVQILEAQPRIAISMLEVLARRLTAAMAQ